MKRVLFVFSFLVLFAGSVFGHPKLDNKLNDKVKKGNGTEKVLVIIQRLTPASANDSDDIGNNGGRIIGELKLINGHAAELPVSALEKIANNPGIKHISLDEPITAHDDSGGTPRVVSGASLARGTYGVSGNGIGVAV